MQPLTSSELPYEKVPEETRPEVLDKYWKIAKGLQAVDDLETSPKLDELSEKNIQGIQGLSKTGI